MEEPEGWGYGKYAPSDFLRYNTEGVDQMTKPIKVCNCWSSRVLYLLPTLKYAETLNLMYSSLSNNCADEIDVQAGKYPKFDKCAGWKFQKINKLCSTTI